MLEIRVFGGLSADGDGASLPRSRRARGLLAWLACHPGMHARSKVAGTFWPDVLDESARASLRTALTELRRALGDAGTHLVATREQLGLGGEDLRVDLRDFETLLAGDNAAEALALARGGELLAGLEDEWVHELREEVLRRRTDLLGAMAADAERRGDLGEAARHAREREALDPLSEEACRELIRLLAEAGDTGAALAAYEGLARRMRERLGVAPSAPTRAVADAAREAAGQPMPEAAGAPRIDLPPALARQEASPFVGRDSELARLREAWGAVARGEGMRVVAIAGEAGIGKSRLAAELARPAHDAGATVLLGRCDEEPLAPYQPLAEALRHAGRAGVRLDARGLAAIVPELGPATADAALADPIAARGRLFAAVGSALRGIAGAGPLLLVLEDLHWADRPTLLLLADLVRFPPGANVMVLATYRDTDVAGDSPLASWLETERRAGTVDTLSLAGLSEPAVESLVATWVGEPVQSLAHRLHQRTAGNALFVEEVLKSGSARDPDEAVPIGVQQAIRARLTRLSPTALQVIRALAVAARGTDMSTIAAVTGLSREAAIEAADELLAERLLRDGDESGRLEFTHALLRDTVYQGLTAPRRGHLHAEVAAALEAADADLHLEEIAHHLFQATGTVEAQRAVAFLERAAERALERLAYEDAVDHAGRALERLGRGDAHRRAALLLLRADGLQRAGTGEASRAAFADAAQAARAAVAPDLLARAALGYGGLGVTIIDVDEDTVSLLEEARAALGDEEPALRARLAGRLAVELYYAPPRERSETLSEEAVTLARESGDLGALAYALNARRVALWRPDRLEDRVKAAGEMLEVAQQAGHGVAELQARNWRVVDLFDLPDMGAWHAEVVAHAELAERLRLPAYRWYTAAWQAIVALLEARFDDARSLVEEARAEGERAGDRNAPLFALMCEGGEAILRGSIETQDVSFVIDKIENSPAAMAYRTSYAWLLAAAGRDDEAREQLAIVARDDYSDLPFDANWLSAIAEGAEAAWLLRDAERAAELYEHMAPYAGRHLTAGRAFGSYGIADRTLGIMAATAGRQTEAIGHLEAGVALNERHGFVVWAVHSRASLGEVLLRVGEDERGRDELARALADTRALSLDGLKRRIASQLGD